LGDEEAKDGDRLLGTVDKKGFVWQSNRWGKCTGYFQIICIYASFFQSFK